MTVRERRVYLLTGSPGTFFCRGFGALEIPGFNVCLSPSVPTRTTPSSVVPEFFLFFSLLVFFFFFLFFNLLLLERKKRYAI